MKTGIRSYKLIMRRADTKNATNRNQLRVLRSFAVNLGTDAR
jgi:hypothetical protein